MPDSLLSKKQERKNPLSRHETLNGAGERTGEGMDRKIKKKRWTPARIGMILAAAAFILLIAYNFSLSAGGSRLNVERDKLTIAPVTQGAFQEFINVTGNVLPRTTVYLDAVEGGRVEEIFVREGEIVQAGQPLLRLSNSDLQLRLMGNEAQLSEAVSNLQTMRFQIEQNRLNLRQQLVQMDYEIQRLERDYERALPLFDRKLVSAEEFYRIRDELEYYQRRRELTIQAHRQDSLSQQLRLDQMQESVDRMRENFSLLQSTLENLMVKAPVSGHLTMLDAEIGELRGPGSRLGQIDVLDGGYKVRAGIDEFYISRVFRDQTGVTQPISGKEYEMNVTRVYPEVRDGRFEVDLDFSEDVPPGIRRGQTIRFNLELGDPAQGILIPRGGFYQTTGGNWIFVVDESGDFAVKRPIRIGRQNPEHYEVLEGLQPGEQVITSSYETFGDADRLIFK